MDDRQITALFLSRDESAVTECEKKYGRLVRRISFRILDDYQACEECANDTLLKTWNSIPPNSPESLKAYVSKIARRTALDCLKSKKALKRGKGEICTVLSELEESLDSGQCVEKEAELSEITGAINSFLYSIDETERNVFVARYWHFAGIRELSDLFGFGQSKIKSMLKRTRDKLRKYLEDNELC